MVASAEEMLLDEVGLAVASNAVCQVAVLARRRLSVASYEAHQFITAAERMTLAVASEAPGGMTDSVSLLFSSEWAAVAAIAEGTAAVSASAIHRIGVVLSCCGQMGRAEQTAEDDCGLTTRADSRAETISICRASGSWAMIGGIGKGRIGNRLINGASVD